MYEALTEIGFLYYNKKNFKRLKMLNKNDILEKVLKNLRVAKSLRLKAKADNNLLSAKIALKQFQVNRLKETHKDLLNNYNTREAALFFLNEIYSFKDLSKRDQDLEKLLPTMGKMFPENTLEVIANAMVLDALTEELETIMALELGKNFTSDEYFKVYKEKTSYENRLQQLQLVENLGNCLCSLVKVPLISTTLKMMRIPAKLANLEEMHEFLNSGFQTFKNTKNPENFIKTLVEREKQILNEIYSKK